VSLRLETFEEVVERAVQRFNHSLSIAENLEHQVASMAKDSPKSLKKKGTGQNSEKLPVNFTEI